MKFKKRGGIFEQAAGQFTPASLGSKLQAEIDFSDANTVTADGNNRISSITDRTGNGNDFVQTTPAARPFWRAGRSAVFDGVDDILTLASGSSTIASDTQGEVFMVCEQTDPYKSANFFSFADDSRNDDYISLVVNFNSSDTAQQADGNILRWRLQDPVGAKNIVVEDSTDRFYYHSMNYNIYSVSCNGVDNRTFYKDGVSFATTESLGTDGFEWFGDITSGNTFAIGGIARSSEINNELGIKYVAVMNAPLTAQERDNMVMWARNTFFGSSSAPNLVSQTLAPTYTLENSRYNWTGAIVKNPVDGTIASVWDRGDTHYLNQDDYHDIVGQISTDGGVTYGGVFTITAGDFPNKLSYTNPSVGYTPTGRLCVIYTQVDRTSGQLQPIGLRYKYSDDNGTTWSSEGQISGIIYTDILNSNSKIITATNGDLLCAYYEIDDFVANRDLVKVVRSTDNGVTWNVYSTIDTQTWDNAASPAPGVGDEPINETTLTVIGTNTILGMTRVNGRNFYNQYISTDNGATWTKQGRTKLGDFWQRDGNTGTQSQYVTLVRMGTFNLDGVDIVVAMYVNRGVCQFINAVTEYPDNSYYRMVFARASDLITDGVLAWETGAPIEFRIQGETLDPVDGYPDIDFFGDNDGVASIRGFIDIFPFGDPQQQTITKVDYFRYQLPLGWLRRILQI